MRINPIFLSQIDTHFFACKYYMIFIFFSVDLFVEDKVSHQGPLPLQVRPSWTVAELKAAVEKELEIPANVQRWILGRQLATDDEKTLTDHGISADGAPIFLYLVTPGKNMFFNDFQFNYSIL